MDRTRVSPVNEGTWPPKNAKCLINKRSSHVSHSPKEGSHNRWGLEKCSTTHVNVNSNEVPAHTFWVWKTMQQLWKAMKNAHSWYHYKDYKMIHLCVQAIWQYITRARKCTHPLTRNLIPENLLTGNDLKE